MTDYQILHLMSTCKLTNDLTRLCQTLCQEGARQCLSGDQQTIPFHEYATNFKSLFYKLEECLVSKNARNQWYELCGHNIPHPPNQEQCTKDFRHLHNEWCRRVPKYGELNTAKYFCKCDELSILYLVVTHPVKFLEL